MSLVSSGSRDPRGSYPQSRKSTCPWSAQSGTHIFVFLIKFLRSGSTPPNGRATIRPGPGLPSPDPGSYKASKCVRLPRLPCPRMMHHWQLTIPIVSQDNPKHSPSLTCLSSNIDGSVPDLAGSAGPIRHGSSARVHLLRGSRSLQIPVC